jgi:hypothetical protein
VHAAPPTPTAVRPRPSLPRCPNVDSALGVHPPHSSCGIQCRRPPFLSPPIFFLHEEAPPHLLVQPHHCRACAVLPIPAEHHPRPCSPPLSRALTFPFFPSSSCRTSPPLSPATGLRRCLGTSSSYHLPPPSLSTRLSGEPLHPPPCPASPPGFPLLEGKTLLAASRHRFTGERATAFPVGLGQQAKAVGRKPAHYCVAGFSFPFRFKFPEYSHGFKNT